MGTLSQCMSKSTAMSAEDAALCQKVADYYEGDPSCDPRVIAQHTHTDPVAVAKSMQHAIEQGTGQQQQMQGQASPAVIPG